MRQFQSQTDKIDQRGQSLLMITNKVKTETQSPKHEARNSVEKTKMEQIARELKQINDKRNSKQHYI